MLGPSDLFASKYRLREVLGRGGMGTVWAAECIEYGTEVAVKVIDPRLLDDQRARQRFAREQRAAAALGGPHIVEVLDYGEAAAGPFIVMELLRGETLGAKLRRERQLCPGEVERIIRETAAAMTVAHERQIIHRDLKPENIFLALHQGGFRVKVLDFGLAQAPARTDAHSISRLTGAGTFVGTLHYTSPEQIQGLELDGRADVWSLGVLGFVLITGMLPFVGRTSAEVLSSVCSRPVPRPSEIAHVPPGFDEWFLRASARDRELRFQRARDLAESLSKVLTDGSSTPCPLTELGSKYREEPRLRLPTDTTATPDQRAAARAACRIPASLEGRRDLNGIALIVNISRTGALLWTRMECEVGQELTITVHFDSLENGYLAPAKVVRIEPCRTGQPRMWRYTVGVVFIAPLPADRVSIQHLPSKLEVRDTCVDQDGEVTAVDRRSDGKAVGTSRD